jgi:hypothetical protein
MKWKIGDVTVTKVVELEVTGGSRFILPQATYEAVLPIGWLRPHFADERGRLKMSIQALVVETKERRIIVDTCLGNDKEGRRIPGWNNLQGPFLAEFLDANYSYAMTETKSSDWGGPWSDMTLVGGATRTGTNRGISSGRVNTQAITVSINAAF